MKASRETDEKVGYILYPDAKERGFIVLPRYTLDIAAAWDAFIWLNKRGLIKLSNGDGDSFDVNFFPYSELMLEALGLSENKLESAHTVEETGALAICRALLIATGNNKFTI